MKRSKALFVQVASPWTWHTGSTPEACPSATSAWHGMPPFFTSPADAISLEQQYVCTWRLHQGDCTTMLPCTHAAARRSGTTTRTVAHQHSKKPIHSVYWL